MNNKRNKHKMKAGTDISEVTSDFSNLRYNQPYQEFDNKYAMKTIRVSNFAGGNSKFNKKMKTILKNAYLDYKNGRTSKLRKHFIQSGGSEFDNALPIKVSDTYMTENLNFSNPHTIRPITRLSNVPYSQLGYNGT